MKELYIEGLASHNGPESCAGYRKVAREVLDRGTRRLGIEPRKSTNQAPTLLSEAEGNTEDIAMRDVQRLGVVGDPNRKLPRVGRSRHMRGNSLAGNRESPESTRQMECVVRVENPIGASR